MAKKKKLKKKKTTPVQDYLTKVKELRKVNEPIIISTGYERQEGLMGEYDFPTDFEFREQVFHVKSLIGRWTVEGNEEENKKPYHGYRLELDNGFQIDLAQFQPSVDQWVLVGVEAELFEKLKPEKK
jgi:hypothetical protein